MNYSMLLEEALEERGNAIGVIGRPVNGADAVIRTAYNFFAHRVGRQEHLLTGLRLGSPQTHILALVKSQQLSVREGQA